MQTTEQKSKATSGPWRVEQDTTIVWGACNRDDQSSYGMGYPIAECRITPSGNWAKGPSADAGEANARLIAAAPDLLAALKAAQPFMRSGDGGTRGGRIEMDRLASIMEAAIAKAEGR